MLELITRFPGVAVRQKPSEIIDDGSSSSCTHANDKIDAVIISDCNALVQVLVLVIILMLLLSSNDFVCVQPHRHHGNVMT